jgi:hypothetical protein
MASISVAGDSSGSISIAAPSAAGSGVLTLPTGTDTLVGKATTDTLTNKSIAATQLTGTIAASALPAGSVLQVVQTQTGAVATTTVTMPFDDTIPQITEGAEFITLAITPSSVTTTLIIQVTLQIAFSGSDWVQVALFKDATANALAVTSSNLSAGFGSPQTFNYKMTSGTTSSITFRVRAGGGSAGTVTVNGTASARKFGGVMASSITITEIAA